MNGRNCVVNGDIRPLFFEEIATEVRRYIEKTLMNLASLCFYSNNKHRELEAHNYTNF